MRAGVFVVAVALASGALIAGCGTGGGLRPFVVPAGQGEPVPEFAQLFEEATKLCRGIRTLTVEGSLAGRVGGQRVRGRVHIGLAEPNAVRIEGVAPFGPPGFILVAQEGTGSLLLPRDKAAVRDVPAPELIESLAGVKVSPDELRAVATGCVAPAAKPTGGQRYGKGTTAIELEGGTTAYLETREGKPVIVASRREGLFVQYGHHVNGLPREMSMANAAASPNVMLTLRIAELETNVQLEPAAFKVDVPADARALTLDELRRSGPLGRPESE